MFDDVSFDHLSLDVVEQVSFFVVVVVNVFFLPGSEQVEGNVVGVFVRHFPMNCTDGRILVMHQVLFLLHIQTVCKL